MCPAPRPADNAANPLLPARLALFALALWTAVSGCAGLVPSAEAEARAHAAAAASTSAADRILQGNTRLQAGEPIAAAEQFSLALEADPQLVDAWIGRASALSAVTSFDGALADLDNALRLDPNRIDALRMRAAIQVRLQAPALALQDLDRLIALAPGDVDARIQRGSLLTELGRAEEAITDFQSVLHSQPDAPTILAMQALAYAHSGNAAAAQSDLARALALGLSAEEAARVRAVLNALSTPNP